MASARGGNSESTAPSLPKGQPGETLIPNAKFARRESRYVYNRIRKSEFGTG